MFDSTTTPAAPSTAERLADATAAHDQAQKRRQAAHAAASVARSEADRAAGALKAMLDAAARAGGSLDPAGHEVAHQDAERAGRAAHAAAAVAAGADRAAEEAAITLHRAQADDLMRRVRDAAAEEVAAAESVDNALTELKLRIKAFEWRVQESRKAVQEARDFDGRMAVLATHNKTAAAMQPHERPRTRIPERLGIVSVKAVLLWRNTMGVSFELMNPLGPWRRAGWEGLAPAGQMPAGPIMREISGNLI